jgi:hypothetical protein
MEGIFMSAARRFFRLLCLLAMLSPLAASANEWVIGDVALVEDYRALSADQPILITLVNKSYYSGGAAASICTERFRVVVGQEGVTADVQKNSFTIALAARLSKEKVRLYVNPDNGVGGGYCAVQIASIGDL